MKKLLDKGYKVTLQSFSSESPLYPCTNTLTISNEYRTKRLSRYPQELRYTITLSRSFTDVHIEMCISKGLYLPSVIEMSLCSKGYFQNHLFRPTENEEIFQVHFELTKSTKYMFVVKLHEPLHENVFNQVLINYLIFDFTNIDEEGVEDVSGKYDILDEIGEKYAKRCIMKIIKSQRKALRELDMTRYNEYMSKLKVIDRLLLVIVKLLRIEFDDVIVNKAVEKQIKDTVRRVVRECGVSECESESESDMCGKIEAQRCKLRDCVNQLELGMEEEDEYFPEMVEERKKSEERVVNKILVCGFGDDEEDMAKQNWELLRNDIRRKMNFEKGIRVGGFGEDVNNCLDNEFMKKYVLALDTNEFDEKVVNVQAFFSDVCFKGFGETN